MTAKLVLVVEDNEDDRQIYGNLLWYNGFDVIFAVNLDQGYWFAREAAPDLILLDVRLPDGDGLDLCRRLKAEPETADIPVIVLSGWPYDRAGRGAAALGCVTYMEKPVPPVTVLAAVERVLGRSVGVSEPRARARG